MTKNALMWKDDIWVKLSKPNMCQKHKQAFPILSNFLKKFHYWGRGQQKPKFDNKFVHMKDNIWEKNYRNLKYVWNVNKHFLVIKIFCTNLYHWCRGQYVKDELTCGLTDTVNYRNSCLKKLLMVQNVVLENRNFQMT